MEQARSLIEGRSGRGRPGSRRRRPAAAAAVFLALVLGWGAGPTWVVAAQEATPDATPGSTGRVEVVAGGLENPRGVVWGPEGELFVALAGTGGTEMSEVDSAYEQENGPVGVAATASVARIEAGCPVPVASGLPSTRGMNGHTQGPAAVAYLDQQLYVLEDAGEGMQDVIPTQPNGVYAVEADGSTRLVADISSWINANPVANVPYDKGALGEPFAMLVAADGSALWVLESNSGQVLRVTPEGTITRLADLSEGHPVPSGLALAPDGGVYVGFLTPAPYPDAGSKVVEVAADGTVTDFWTGLTAVTGLAVGPDGALLALEMATGNLTEPPYLLPGSGRVVRRTGPTTQEEVVTGLDFPIAMALGPDGGLYVSGPAFGGEDDGGEIVRFALGGPEPIVVDPARLSVPACAPMATPLAGDTTGATPTAATPGVDQEGLPTADASSVVPDDGKGATGQIPVGIVEFSFAPGEVAVPRGTTVVWTNLDSVAHTVTSTEPGGVGFDSGQIEPGGSFSFTFEEPGRYPYTSLPYPSMTGTVVVE